MVRVVEGIDAVVEPAVKLVEAVEGSVVTVVMLVVEIVVTVIVVKATEGSIRPILFPASSVNHIRESDAKAIPHGAPPVTR